LRLLHFKLLFFLSTYFITYIFVINGHAISKSIKYLNNIFLKHLKPTSSGKRFKLLIYRINLFKQKKCFFYLHKTSQVRKNNGTISMLSKGKGTKHKKIHYLQNKFLFNQLYILLNYIIIKKKYFSLIKYANGSMAYITPSAGLFINDFSLASTLPGIF